MIHEFIRRFTDAKITAVKIGNGYYLCNPEIARMKNRIKMKPSAAGTFLGEKKNNSFEPSAALLETISETSDKKVFLNKNGEWLFLCGRDVFGKSIKAADYNEPDELVLVQNELRENIGYGQIIADVKHGRNKDKVVIKNLFDRGSFLRREKNS